MIKEDMKKLINKKEKLESTGLKKSINIYQKVFKIDKKLQRTFAVFVKRKGVWHNKSTRKSNKINNITKKYTGTQIPTKRASGKRYPHISYVNNKANKSFGFIRRNMRVCKPIAKDQAYKAIVRTSLKYASTEWDPYAYTKLHIDSIEILQRRAARFVVNNYSPGTITNIL